VASTRPYAAGWAISLGHRRIVHGPWYANTQAVMGRVVLHPGLPCCGHDPWACTVTEQRYSTAEHGKGLDPRIPRSLFTSPRKNSIQRCKDRPTLYVSEPRWQRLTCVCPTVDFLSQVASLPPSKLPQPTSTGASLTIGFARVEDSATRW